MATLPKRIRENVLFDSRKFAELILYIAKKSESDERFGATKLNKILHYSDFEAYRKLGKPITGADYKHISEGAAPNQLLPIRTNMIRDGDLEIVDNPYYGKKQKRPVAKRAPILDSFDQQELQIVDGVIDRLWADNADDVSEKSHNELGYRLTNPNEIIPYAFTYFIERPLTQPEIELGLQIAKRYGFE